MHLAWMASPRKATRVNANRDLQAAIVRKVRITERSTDRWRPRAMHVSNEERNRNGIQHTVIKNLFPLSQTSFSKDVDECSEDKHNCSPKAACQNTEGSFKCKCNHGYQGDGESCIGEQFLLHIRSFSNSKWIGFGKEELWNESVRTSCLILSNCLFSTSLFFRCERM